jgi:hypothetical protein
MITHTPTALSLPLRTPRFMPRVPARAACDVSPRFTTDGSLELEQHLARTCEKIAAGIRGLVSPQRLEGLLLAGGYGRGEGGVLRAAGGDRPYNDLEFYVFLRGSRHVNEFRFGRALHVLGEILTPQAGAEVEFKIASLRELAASPVNMFSYDLVLGHRWIAGNDELLAQCGHHFEADRIPLSEATRLLMNRCSGLLFARERLERPVFSASDADFVRRNIAKAQLALGDAMLVARGEYHWSVRERHRELERLARLYPTARLNEVSQHHTAGVEFKLRPERSTATREELATQHAIVSARAKEIWFWIEEQRLRTTFATPHAYATSPCNKWPESTGLRTALVNLRALGWQPLRQGRGTRHPRERILNVMTLLLWEPDAHTSPEHLRFVQRELQTRATSFRELMDAYRALWSRVN